MRKTIIYYDYPNMEVKNTSDGSISNSSPVLDGKL